MQSHELLREVFQKTSAGQFSAGPLLKPTRTRKPKLNPKNP